MYGIWNISRHPQPQYNLKLRMQFSVSSNIGEVEACKMLLHARCGVQNVSEIHILKPKRHCWCHRQNDLIESAGCVVFSLSRLVSPEMMTYGLDELKVMVLH